MNIYTSCLFIILLALFPLHHVNAWYQLLHPSAMYSMGGDLPKDHNPKLGILHLRKNKKSDEETMNILNSMKYHQTRNATNKEHILRHSGEPPVIGHVSPLGGPLKGGTNITVHGINFESGDKYKCKFADKVVEAYYRNETDTIHCTSPPWATDLSRHEVDFRIAIFYNADHRIHQFASHYRKFTYYDPEVESPIILSMSPQSGPITGGTVISILGYHIADRSSYTCNFDDVAVPAYHEFSQHSDLLEEVLTCISPPHASNTIDFHITSVSINAISHSFKFTYYEVPIAESISPTSVDILGGCPFSISLTQKEPLDYTMRESISCRFGLTVVPAFFDYDNIIIKCMIPPQSIIPFATADNSLPKGGNVFLGNRIWTNIAFLQTEEEPSSFLKWMHDYGNANVTLIDFNFTIPEEYPIDMYLPSPRPIHIKTRSKPKVSVRKINPLVFFESFQNAEASFQKNNVILSWTGTEEYIKRRNDHDLICFWEHIEDQNDTILYAGAFRSASLKENTFSFPDILLGNGRQYIIRYEHRESKIGCDWYNTTNTWGNYTIVIDPLYNNDLSLWNGYESTRINVAISFNNQQFHPMGKITYMDPWFTDLNNPGAPKSVFSFHPHSGPDKGGTVISISTLPLRSRDILSAQCVFNEIIVDAFVDVGNQHEYRETNAFTTNGEKKIVKLSKRLVPESLRCISPPLTSFTILPEDNSVTFGIMLNNIRYDKFNIPSDKIFHYYTQPKVLSLSASNGYAGANIVITLENSLPIHLPLYVRFDNVALTACLYDGTIQIRGYRCVVPDIPAHGRIPLTLSGNGQQFSSRSQDFYFILYDQPHVHNIVQKRGPAFFSTPVAISVSFFHFEPRAGPIEGNTIIKISGRDYSGGSKYKCKFGKKIVPAVFHFDGGTVISSDSNAEGVGFGNGGGGRHGIIVCKTPAVIHSGYVDFALSLDGVHFFEVSSNQFLYYDMKPVEISRLPYNLAIEKKAPSFRGGDLIRIGFNRMTEECGFFDLELCRDYNLIHYVGMNPRCRFEDVETFAIYSSNNNCLLCMIPFLESSTSNPQASTTSLAVSFNGGVDYIHAGNFTYYSSNLLLSGVSYWPKSGSDEGGTIITVLNYQLSVPMEVIAQNISKTGIPLTRQVYMDILRCKFGNEIVTVNIVDNEDDESDMYGVLNCVAPFHPGPGLVSFSIYILPSENEFINFESNEAYFRYHPRLVPLHFFPSSSVSFGGTEIFILGVNLTSEVPYYIQFQQIVNNTLVDGPIVAGVPEIHLGRVSFRTPTVLPGVWKISLSCNNLDFYPAPGAFVVLPSTRLTITPLVNDNKKAILRYSTSPFDNETGKREIVEHITVVFFDGTTMSLNRVDRKFDSRDFDWMVVFPIDDQADPIQIYEIKIKYSQLSRQNILASLNVDYTDKRLLHDDNEGRGWTWIWKIIDNVGVWHETLSTSALKNGKLWNERGQIIVHFQGRGWNATSDGIYHSDFGAVVTATPNLKNLAPLIYDTRGAFKSNDLASIPTNVFDGDSLVRISLNGIQWSAEQHVKYNFDSRFDMQGRETLILRIVPYLLIHNDLTMPFNAIGRELFDSRITYDLSSVLGLDRSRLVVSSVHSDSGIVEIICAPSRLPADPNCLDVKHSLAAFIRDHNSQIYDGIITWALDPVFPNALAEFANGKLYINGYCSDPAYLTEEDCLNAGECSCSEYDGQYAVCISSISVSGATCTWISNHRWIKKRKELKFDGCPDPTKTTKEECEAVGVCATDNTKTTRESCLGVGICKPPVGYVGSKFDFSTIKNEAECRDPSKRQNSNNGKCVAKNVVDADFDFSPFKNKMTCESPTKRHIKSDKNPHVSSCGTCVQGPSSPFEIFPFSYGQFITRENCVNPASRALPVIGACEMVERFTCFQDTGIIYPLFFRCDQFSNNQTCSDPLQRKISPLQCTLLSNTANPIHGHCTDNSNNNSKYLSGKYPDLSLPFGDIGVTIKNGPPCVWVSSKADFNIVSHHTIGDNKDCGYGPKGQWNSSKCPNDKGNSDKGPPGIWLSNNKKKGGASGGGAWDDESSGPPGEWESQQQWDSKLHWTEGITTPHPCPCNWQAKKHHLTKCNWKTCGPSAGGTSGSVQTLMRLKGPNEMVNDYQAFVNVGGSDLWMTIETGVATTWVMTSVCFTEGCKEVKTFSGGWWPAMPPIPTPLDIFERGLLQLGAMIGIPGHSFVNVAGHGVFGCPVIIGLLDLGDVISPMSFNHTGAIGLGFWEDNLPTWLLPLDPSTSMLTFMMTGNILFPVPVIPIPIPKDFILWGIPWCFPSGMVFSYSLFFSDRGGCFYMGGGGSGEGITSVHNADGAGLVWAVAMPIAIKFLLPGWLFFLTDVLVDGVSIEPCMLGFCRAMIKSGQFSISGPMDPLMTLLEVASAPKTCENMEDLPDITFIMMGVSFTMTRHDYVVQSESYGEVECITSMTPDMQLIPGLEMFIFGDVFLHAFYAAFNNIPFKRMGLAHGDHRYYEKNGCVSGTGEGPIGKIADPDEATIEHDENAAKKKWDQKMDKKVETMGWKRWENWQADLKQINEENEKMDRCAILGPASGCECGSGFSFRSGSCIKEEFAEELHNIRMINAGILNANTEEKKRIQQSIDDFIESQDSSNIKEDMYSENTASNKFFDGIISNLQIDESEILINSKKTIQKENEEAFIDPFELGFDTRYLSTSSSEIEKATKRFHERYNEEVNLFRQRKKDFNLHKNENLKNHHVRMNELISKVTTRHDDDHPKEYWPAKEAHDEFHRFVGEHVELYRGEISDLDHRKELIHNMTIIMHAMMPLVNVTEDMMEGWWRGEDEEYIEMESKYILEKYEANLREARRVARSFKVKNAINNRIMHKLVEKQASLQVTKDVLKEAQSLIDYEDDIEVEERLEREKMKKNKAMNDIKTIKKEIFEKVQELDNNVNDDKKEDVMTIEKLRKAYDKLIDYYQLHQRKTDIKLDSIEKQLNEMKRKNTYGNIIVED